MVLAVTCSCLAAQEPVPALSGYQAESSLVTQKEMAAVDDWVTNLSGNKPAAQAGWIEGWVHASMPFAFTYDGKHSDAFLSGWDFEARQMEATDAFKLKRLRWTDPRTRLEVTCELKQFTEFPAIEWVLRFQNKGDRQTPVIQDVQALRLSLQHQKEKGAYTVHAAQGGRSLPDDMMPFTWQSGERPDGKAFVLGGSTSSNKHMPFWNIETPESRGILVGVGWTGFWQAEMTVQDRRSRRQA